MIRRLWLYKIYRLQQELKKQKNQKAYLSTQVSDLRLVKRVLTQELQATKLELAILNEK